MTNQQLAEIQQMMLAADADELLMTDERAYLVVGSAVTPMTSPFASADALKQFALQLARGAGVRLDPMCGAAGGSLAGDAWRWHSLLPPLSRDGILFSLRRHRFEALSLASFVVADDVRSRLLAAFAARQHLLFVGPTNSGKTSLMMALLKEHALQERVVIIESLPELPRLSPLWVRLAARGANVEGLGLFGMQQLLVEALRLRPDRLVIGEVRGPEAATLVDAMATGHAGVMATLHAGDAQTAVERLRRWDQQAALAPLDAMVVEMQRAVPPLVRAVRPLLINGL